MKGETLGLLTPSTPSYTQKAINKYLLNEQINEMVDERMKEKKCMGETEGCKGCPERGPCLCIPFNFIGTTIKREVRSSSQDGKVD